MFSIMRIDNSTSPSRLRRAVRPSSSSNRASFVLLFALFLIVASGCSNQYAEEAIKKAGAVEKQLSQLGKKIDSGSLVNIRIINTYADRLADKQPAFKDIATQLRLDATTRGPLYQGLHKRLAGVNRSPGNKQEFANAYQELSALEAGSDPVVYNDALLDVVNTLADLSQGGLPRINVPPGTQAASVKGGQVPGSYLVGNPEYGQWKTDSSGHSFWEWYGMYRMFTDVAGLLGGGFGGGFHRGPIYQDAWYGRSRHSFYHDAGRSTYGSRADRNTWQQGRERLARQGIKTPRPKNYGSVAGKKRVSTYASRRSRTSSALKSGRMPSSSPSTRAKSSTTGNVKRRSSFFSASSRGTGRRGFRRGK